MIWWLTVLMACKADPTPSSDPTEPTVATTPAPTTPAPTTPAPTTTPYELDGAKALVDVTVLVMDPADSRLEGQTVLTVAGEVHAILPADTVLGEGIEVVGSGGYVLPGLADMHGHNWFEEELKLYVANGVTSARVLFGDPMHVQWRTEIEAGERIGPSLRVAGPIIDGFPPIWPGSTIATNREAGEAVAAVQQADGYDELKVYSRLTVEAWEGVLDGAAAVGMPVGGHVPFEVDYVTVVDSDQRSIEHLDQLMTQLAGVDWLDGASEAEVEAALAAVTREDVEAIADQLAATGTYNVPTLTVWRGVHLTEEEEAARWSEEAMGYAHPDLVANWQFAFPTSPDAQRSFDRVEAAWHEWVGILHERGAGIVAGTDNANRFVVAGFSLHDELQHLVDAGLSPYDALQAATANAAAMVGEGEVWGQVAVGQRADLVWLADDPTADIGATRTPQGVMLRGEWLPRERLDELLQEVLDAYPDGAGAPLPASPSPCGQGHGH